MIELSDKRILRKRILEACLKKQQSLIDDFNARIKSILDSQGLGNEEEYDHSDVSQQGQASQEVTGLNEALSLANEEMLFLLRLNPTEYTLQTTVRPGAIVVTDKGSFFISVSIEKFDVDGETLFGISTKSPLYRTMKGLPTGSQFQHNGLIYRITDIY